MDPQQAAKQAHPIFLVSQQLVPQLEAPQEPASLVQNLLAVTSSLLQELSLASVKQAPQLPLRLNKNQMVDCSVLIVTQTSPQDHFSRLRNHLKLRELVVARLLLPRIICSVSPQPPQPHQVRHQR